MWHAHLSSGFFSFTNNENRYSQYLNRVGPADIDTATTGSFSEGSGEVDYDHYVQLRELAYVDFGAGVDFDAKTHLDLTVNSTRAPAMPIRRSASALGVNDADRGRTAPRPKPSAARPRDARRIGGLS
jgi:hypothetical protein